MMLTRKEIESQLIEVAQQFLYETGIGKRKINLDNSLQLHLGLGSLARLELFMEIEKYFNVQFSDEDLSEINTLRDVSEKILKWSPQKTAEIPLHVKNELQKVFLEKAETLIDILLQYAEKDPNRNHIYFQDEVCNEVIITYGQLLDKALNIAQSLLSKGVKPGDRIAMMLPNQPIFFYTFFGILLVNCVPVPLEPLLRSEIYYSFAEQLAPILQKVKPSLLITFSEIKPFNRLMHSLVPSLQEIYVAGSLLADKGEGFSLQAKGTDLALIQYTIDTQIKEVTLTHQDILSQLHSYGQKLKLTTDDVVMSWMPLYRNPGLVGMWLGCFYHGIPLILMPVYPILNKPERWLWAIHYNNATISCGDAFAYELCLKKISPAFIEGLDLSLWRLALNMGETVSSELQEKFYQRFAPYGFKKEAFFPVSGFLESPLEPEKMSQLEYLAPQAYQTFLEMKKEKPSFLKSYAVYLSKKLLSLLTQGLKLIYTLYVFLVFLVTVPPFYLCSWFMGANAYAKLLHYWARLVFALMFCPIRIYNKHGLYLHQKAVFVVNHASYMDTPLMMAVCPSQAKIVAKKVLTKVPVIGRVIRKLGHVCVDRIDFPAGIKQSIKKIQEALTEGPLIVFPEGTFSYASGLRPFKLGAFKVACDSNVPVIPIATQGTRRLLRDQHYLLRPVVLEVYVGNPIMPLGNEYQDYIQLRKEVRKYMEEHCGEPSLNLIASKAVANVPPPPDDLFF